MNRNSIPLFAFIIGSMKSGTTNLFDLLAQHPEISPCRIKEPEFFVKDQNYNEGISSYYKLWDYDHHKHKVALEASTSYTKIPCFKNAAEIIKENEINAKFIYMMRHPIERIKSQIQMSRINKWEYFNGDGSIHKRTLINPIAFSKYHMQISEYYKLFASDQILLLSFEQFKENPESTLIQICDFLGINSNFQFMPNEANKHEGSIYMYRNTFIVRAIFGINSYVEYNKYLWPKNKSRKLKILKWYLNWKNKLSYSQKRYIKSEIKEDLEKLKNEFGFDTSIWKL